MFRTNMLMRETLRFLSCVGQHPLAFVGQRQIDRSGNLLPNRSVTFNLFPDGFNRSMGAEKAICQRLILSQKAKQQVLSLNIWGTKLAGLIPCKEDDAPRLFCIPFEHVPP